ncbi:MAG: glycosyltransferase family 2 protein [Patescibacteria group bacterium]
MAKKRITLSVALAVYNEASNLERCLRSVGNLADEMIVVDGGSSDATVDIAKRLAAKVYHTDNPAMFHINKQKALDKSSGEWILQLDADEVVSASLKEEIRDVIVSGLTPNGYFISRHNYFLGDWLRKGGQYPDYVIRLFRNGFGEFPQQSVHEQIKIDGPVGHLNHALEHYSYTSIAQYWDKSSAYIRLTADELSKRKDSRSVATLFSYLIAKPVGTFLSLYLRHKGFVDGWRGFLFAFFSAMHFPKAYILSITQAS